MNYVWLDLNGRLVVDVIVYVLVFTDAQMECNEAVSRELELQTHIHSVCVFVCV